MENPLFLYNHKYSFQRFYVAVYYIIIINYVLLAMFHSLVNPGITRLAEIHYSQYSIIFFAIVSTPLVCLIFLLTLVPIILSISRLKYFTWDTFNKLDRLILYFIVLLITWILVASPTNFYFGHHRTVDRILLILIAIGVFYRPSFIPIYCLYSFTLFNELSYPLGDFYLSEKGALLNILILSISFFITKTIIKEIRSELFIFLAAIIHIQNYFWSGVEKLKTGGKEIFSWIFENETSLLIVKSRLDGFLHQIDLDYFISATSFMHSLNVPLNFIVIFLELSICLVFYHKKFLSIYLISCSLLNLGIFLQTGIFFYEWLLLGILFSFIVLKREWGAISFAKTIGPLAFILILFGSTWHYPHKLGWVDYPILNMIEIYAQNKNGEIIIIDENSFDPYDRSFNYDENYLFFAKNKIISRYYFIYFFDMRYFFEVVHSPEEFVKFQNHMGHYFYDQKKIKKFDRFVKKYFASKRIKKSALLKWDVFRLPFHLYHTKESPLKENFEDIESVIVVYKQYLILKNKPILIIDKEVHRVKVQ